MVLDLQSVVACVVAEPEPVACHALPEPAVWPGLCHYGLDFDPRLEVERIFLADSQNLG